MCAAGRVLRPAARYPSPPSHPILLFRSPTNIQGVGFSKAAAYFADWLRTAHGLPQRRLALPLVLTNKSVLAGGQSLPYIAHPWLPQAILGYDRRVSGSER